MLSLSVFSKDLCGIIVHFRRSITTIVSGIWEKCVDVNFGDVEQLVAKSSHRAFCVVGSCESTTTIAIVKMYAVLVWGDMDGKKIRINLKLERENVGTFHFW